MAIKVFRQGDDVKIPVKIASTPAVDFSGALVILVALYVGGKLQYRYKSVEESGFGKCEVDPVADDTINVFVERIQSVSFSVGSVVAYVIASYTDTDFPDGERSDSYEATVARVNEGKALEESI